MNSSLEGSSLSLKSNTNNNIIFVIFILVTLYIIFYNKPKCNKDDYLKLKAERFKLDGYNDQRQNSRDRYNHNNMLNDNQRFLGQGEPLMIRNNEPRVIDKVRFDEQNNNGNLAAINQLKLQKLRSNQNNTSCNMLNMDPKLLSKNQQKFYDLYKHQVQCPKDCHLNHNYKGILKDNLYSSCNKQPKNLQNYRTLQLLENNLEGTIPIDTDNNLQKLNELNELNKLNKLNEVETENQVKVNNNRFENRNKFADFKDKIEQNSIVFTQVDKLAEIRTSQDPSLGKYGQSIKEIYNNLLESPYTNNKNSCNNKNITGYLSTSAPTLDYEFVNN